MVLTLQSFLLCDFLRESYPCMPIFLPFNCGFIIGWTKSNCSTIALTLCKGCSKIWFHHNQHVFLLSVSSLADGTLSKYQISLLEVSSKIKRQIIGWHFLIGLFLMFQRRILKSRASSQNLVDDWPLPWLIIQYH